MSDGGSKTNCDLKYSVETGTLLMHHTTQEYTTQSPSIYLTLCVDCHIVLEMYVTSYNGLNIVTEKTLTLHVAENIFGTDDSQQICHKMPKQRQPSVFVFREKGVYVVDYLAKMYPCSAFSFS